MEEKVIEMMGRVDARLEDLDTLKKDVATIKSDFSNLKGKIVVVAGIITFAGTGVWTFVKGLF